MKRLVGQALVLVLIAGCAQAGDVQVDDVWARTSASMQDAGAVYMTISGGDEADSLIGVRVGSDVAARAEMHESMMMEGDDEGGMMQMHAVESILVEANAETKLEPGGYHVMLQQLAEPLVDGAEFTLTLTFQNAGDIDVTVEVREG